MKFSVTQTDLSRALDTAARAVPSRAIGHPILANFLLSASKDKLSISATDLSLGICTAIPAEIEDPGDFTVSARLFADIVGKLPAGQIVLSLKKETLHIQSTSGGFDVRGLGAGEYPEIFVEMQGSALTLPTDKLIRGIRYCGCPSVDETKQVLTGIHVLVADGALEMAATDGHRLSVYRTEIETEDSQEVVIPARALADIGKMAAGTETVVLELDQTCAVLSVGEQRLSTRILDDQYPNYRQLIPAQFATTVTVDRRQLLAALELVAVLANQKNNVVRLDIGAEKQEITVRAECAEVGSGAMAVAAQVTGNGLSVAFNVKYLLDGCKYLDSQEIQISLNSSVSPVILRPLGGDDALYLCMPVQIRE